MNTHPTSEHAAATEMISGAEAVTRTLENLGVETVFGLPGGAIMPVYDALYTSKLQTVLVRHEQGAGHAAEGYAIASGKTGVAIVTSGPGATNVLTAIADAHMDSIPLVVITGQVGASALGTDAFQEADMVGSSMPFTKHNFMVRRAADISRTISEAFHLASTGRKGPVLVDITKNAQQEFTEYVWPPVLELPGYIVPKQPADEMIVAAVELMRSARRPVIYAGGGIIASESAGHLRELAELTGMPVVCTLTGQGAFPSTHPQCLGMPGMHGNVTAVTAMQRADLLLTLGARFDDRVTGKVSAFAPEAKVIHIDIDPAELGKIRRPEIGFVADLKYAIPALSAQWRATAPDAPSASQNPQSADTPASHPAPTEVYREWYEQIRSWQQQYPLTWVEPTDGALAAQYVVKRIGELAGPDAIYCTGVGQHQMWAQQFLPTVNPRHFLTSGGLGTMGVSVPEALGAQVACPEKTVWAIDGDGCFQMTNQELAVARILGLPLKVAIINNQVLGMVHQWQDLFFEQRYSNTILQPLTAAHPETPLDVPDFVKLAEAYDCVGLRARTKEEVDDVIRQAMAVTDRPVVIDFRVSTQSEVWPMVAAGASNSDIMYSHTSGPIWSQN